MVQEVFRLLQEKKKNNEGLDTRVRVSYVELYREELRDLLELQNIHKELHIREDERGNTGHFSLDGTIPSYYLMIILVVQILRLV